VGSPRQVVLAILDGLPKPQVNQPLRFADRTYYPDFRWPEQHLIVEADGRQFHEQPLARADDAARQAFLEARGERVLRVTWRQATLRPRRTRAHIEAALRGVL
jgi:very-short-patch-repair endonuclease